MAHGAFRAGVLAACAVGALAVFLENSPALAQTQSVSSAVRSVSQAERDRAGAAAQAQRLRARQAQNRVEIASLDTRLVQAGQRRAAAEAAATDAETRLVALRLRVKADGARYRQDRNAFEAALISAAFAEHRLEPSATHAGMFASAVAPAYQYRIHQTSEALAEARRLDLQIAEEQSALMQAQSAIDGERADMVSLLAQRRATQTTLIIDAAVAEQRARRFAAEARTLRELAQRVQARVQARRTAPAGNTPSIIPAAWLAPASGRLFRPFGAQAAGGPATQGVTLRTRVGAQVIAPASGEVAYAGPFRGYGQVLILNLDNGYVLVLTGLGVTRALVGETVIAGQLIGEMTNSDTPAPDLYVEVRRNGRSIDPARWLGSRGIRLEAERAADRSG